MNVRLYLSVCLLSCSSIIYGQQAFDMARLYSPFLQANHHLLAYETNNAYQTKAGISTTYTGWWADNRDTPPTQFGTSAYSMLNVKWGNTQPYVTGTWWQDKAGAMRQNALALQGGMITALGEQHRLGASIAYNHLDSRLRLEGITNSFIDNSITAAANGTSKHRLDLRVFGIYQSNEKIRLWAEGALLTPNLKDYQFQDNEFKLQTGGSIQKVHFTLAVAQTAALPMMYNAEIKRQFALSKKPTKYHQLFIGGKYGNNITGNFSYIGGYMELDWCEKAIYLRHFRYLKVHLGIHAQNGILAGTFMDIGVQWQWWKPQDNFPVF